MTSSIPTNRTAIQNLQKNILDIFGQNNRPRPDLLSSIRRATSSAKKYMLHLYKLTDLNDQDNITSFNVSNKVVDNADTVVSFVNHGKVLFLLFSPSSMWLSFIFSLHDRIYFLKELWEIAV